MIQSSIPTLIITKNKIENEIYKQIPKYVLPRWPILMKGRPWHLTKRKQILKL